MTAEGYLHVYKHGQEFPVGHFLANVLDVNSTSSIILLPSTEQKKILHVLGLLHALLNCSSCVKIMGFDQHIIQKENKLRLAVEIKLRGRGS